MKHYLNVCDVNGGEIAPVDIITFGSPCQDLSVAGKRGGLKHDELGDGETTRSGLFMEAVRIIKEMRMETNGRYPTFAVWENVPGAFSSQKGEDFRVVLEELAKIKASDASVPRPPHGKCADAGAIMGDGWSVAWRVLDAQFHGVPQRRRRILLVADFAGGRAGEILFECSGLPGYPAESGAAGQGAKAGGIGWQEEVSPTLKSTLSGGNTVPTICLQGNGIDRADTAGCNGRGWTADVCYTLNTIDRPAVCLLDDQGGSVISATEDATVAPAIRAQMHWNIPAVVCDARGNGDGAIVPTITGDHGRTISDYTAVAVETYQQVTGPLMANSHPGSYTGQDAFSDMLVAGKTFQNTGRGWWNESSVGATIRTACGGDSTKANVVVETIRAAIRYIVRRLTPTECARLQGFPDWWSELPTITGMSDEDYAFWCDVLKTKAEIENKPYKPKTRPQMVAWYNKLHNDGAEYKMWGNGVALPVVRVPLHEMAKLGARTLGSLFDGSGGFPLAGVLEGITPLWASEIEPYPIAVTRARFGGAV